MFQHKGKPEITGFQLMSELIDAYLHLLSFVGNAFWYMMYST